MSFLRLRRLTIIGSGALLGLMLIAPGLAMAKPPGWAITAHATPPKVVNGADAGWKVTVANNGKSNISAVFVVTDHEEGDPLADPTYVSGTTWTGQVGPADACHDVDGRLLCDLGNIVAKASVTFTVAFPTPATGTSYGFTFLGFGNGNTPSDGGTSHGDFVPGPASVNLTTDKNFAGKFATNLNTIADSSDLGPKNIQFSSLLPPAANIGVSLEDGLPNSAFTCPNTIPQCGNAFGEWTRLYVDNGASFANGIKVVTTILGNKVPNDATTDNIVLVHVPLVGPTYVLGDDEGERCLGDGLNPDSPADPDSVGEECISVSEVGNNFQIVAWFIRNGGNRLGY